MWIRYFISGDLVCIEMVFFIIIILPSVFISIPTYVGRILVIQSKCLIRYELGISSMIGLHVHVGKSSRITTLHFGLFFQFWIPSFSTMALWQDPASMFIYVLTSLMHILPSRFNRWLFLSYMLSWHDYNFCSIENMCYIFKH
jgi:hypothetical protein